MTRIIAGVAKGRRLTVPKQGTRPTSDRVRESMFSAIAAHLLKAGRDWQQISVLDLYSGTGALGLEALSRGANRVVMVEKARAAGDVIRANMTAVALPGAEIIVGDVGAIKARLGAQPFDLVLADPPYELASTSISTVLLGLEVSGLLTQSALVIVERTSMDRQSPFPLPWEVLQRRRHGDTTLWYGQAPEHVRELQ